MKKLYFIVLISIFLFIAIAAVVAYFFIPKNVSVKQKQPVSSNDSFKILLANLDKHPTSSVYIKTISDFKESLIAEKESFLEINLEEMKVRLYQDGKMIKEFPILTAGDPQEWGGSAAGLYKIISGNKISYSIVSKVYMPYALHYYGKYYIHGEPYYPNGKKLISPVSGGCIRLLNKDAKDIYNSVQLNMPVLVIGKSRDSYKYNISKVSKFPKLSAKSYLVADLGSGFVFAEKNPDQQLPIASITKLMTAVVVSENVDLRKSITVTKDMLDAYGCTKGLEAGKTFRVEELFYPLLIESSNDAAEVLSRFLGRSKTIKMMNEKAKSILMMNTKFVDPHGLDTKNVSTVTDLFQLARYVLNNRPPFLKISKGQKVKSFGKIHFDIKNLWNKNVFVNDPSFVGGKTGFLAKPRHSALFIFRLLSRDNEKRNIAIILLESDNDEIDAQRVYIWLLKNYF